MTVSEILSWRYATKKFDPAMKIPQDELNELLEALRLAPSSFGLQPWKFIVVEDPKLRKELQTHSWGQPQITDASELVVLCVVKDLNEAYVKSFVKQIAAARGVDPASLKSYEDMMLSSVKNQTKEQVVEWSKRQVYIALGFLMYAASERRIDSCPMEGFDSKKYDEILKLGEQGLQSVVLCTLGYRAKDDAYAALKKVRLAPKEVLVFKK